MQLEILSQIPVGNLSSYSEKVSKKTKNCIFTTFVMSFLCSIKALYTSKLTFLIDSDSSLQGLQAGMRGLSRMSILPGALSFKGAPH